VPAIPSFNDPSAVEVGVKFTPDLSGYILGLRFYKGSANTGTHIGNLWTSTGTLLATATFTAETASGWQQVNFSTPLLITANTVYVASYHTDVGGYAVDQGYFATTGFNDPPLHALQDGASGGNGVFLPGASGFPTNTFQSDNYWIDVVFNTTLSSLTMSPTSVTGGNPSIGTVTLSGPAPSSGEQVTLSSSNPAVATVPTSMTVPAGSTSATFPVTTSAVAASTQVTITASDSGTLIASLTVIPPVVSSLALNPSSVTGGPLGSSTGTVTLNGPAPGGVAQLTLSSNNSAATVPASVTVPAGATSATFPVTTSIVVTSQTATISGSYNNTTQSANLAVHSAVPGI
jgi:hypothetical protein